MSRTEQTAASAPFETAWSPGLPQRCPPGASPGQPLQGARQSGSRRLLAALLPQGVLPILSALNHLSQGSSEGQAAPSWVSDVSLVGVSRRQRTSDRACQLLHLPDELWPGVRGHDGWRRSPLLGLEPRSCLSQSIPLWQSCQCWLINTKAQNRRFRCARLL